jgi:hypothetical protein
VWLRVALGKLCSDRERAVLVLNHETLSPAQKMGADRMTVVHGCARRLSGRRTDRTKLTEP